MFWVDKGAKNHIEQDASWRILNLIHVEGLEEKGE